MGTLRAQIYEEFRQFVWSCLHKKASQMEVWSASRGILREYLLWSFVKTTYHMEDPEIPKVASEHLGPQHLPEISHCDCAGVNCTQKSRQRGAH